MVRLRLKRMGRRHRPFYRLNAVEKRTQRDGRVLEQLGWVDPMAAEGRQVELNTDRIKHWLNRGAQPSDTVADILAKHEIIDPEKRKAELQMRYGKKMKKIAEEKTAAEAAAKAEAEAAAKAAAEEEAKAKAEAEAAAASSEDQPAEEKTES